MFPKVCLLSDSRPVVFLVNTDHHISTPCQLDTQIFKPKSSTLIPTGSWLSHSTQFIYSNFRGSCSVTLLDHKCPDLHVYLDSCFDRPRNSFQCCSRLNSPLTNGLGFSQIGAFMSRVLPSGHVPDEDFSRKEQEVSLSWYEFL